MFRIKNQDNFFNTTTYRYCLKSQNGFVISAFVKERFYKIRNGTLVGLLLIFVSWFQWPKDFITRILQDTIQQSAYEPQSLSKKKIFLACCCYMIDRMHVTQLQILQKHNNFFTQCNKFFLTHAFVTSSNVKF